MHWENNQSMRIHFDKNLDWRAQLKAQLDFQTTLVKLTDQNHCLF